MKRFASSRLGLLIAVLAMCLLVFAPLPISKAQQPSNTNYNAFSGAFAAPYLSGVGTTTLRGARRVWSTRRATAEWPL